MKSKFTIIAIVLCFAIIFSSCQQNSNANSFLSSSNATYSINVQTVGSGNAIIQKNSGTAGEQNMLVAIPSNGCLLVSITIYGQTLQNLNFSGRYEYPFIMQPQNTTISVIFTTQPNSSSQSSMQSQSASVSSSLSISSQESSNAFSSSSSLLPSSTTSSSSSIASSSNSFESSSSSVVSSSSSAISSSSSSVVEPNLPNENQKPTLSTIDTGVSGLGDPFILADSKTNTYYMYATSNQPTGFKVWTSKDLKSWTDKGECYSEITSGQWTTPFNDSYWAPEVVYNSATQKYIMYFSATERGTNCKKIGVATSDSPLGPFVHSVGIDGVMFDKGLNNVAFIDAHFFLDTDGKAYLLYCNDCSKNVVNGVNTSQTWIRELDSSWTKVVGAGKMISTPTQTWETQEDSGSPNTQWNEAPALIKYNGTYYLTYSANPYWNSYYGVGCAVSNNIFGEYIKYDYNPILTRIEGVNGGLGHNMFFKDFNGNLWTSYHRHTNMNNPSDNRTAMLSPVWFDNGVLKIEYGQLYEEETTHKNESVKEEKEPVDITTKSPKKTIYTNITNIGDPFVLVDENSKKYYMYATSDSDGYRVWESCDLVNWTDKGQCFNKETSNTFGHSEFWAPEVVYNPNTKTYIMYYTARDTALRDLGVSNDGTAGNYNEAYNNGVLKTGVATSFSPLGPFKDCTGAPMFDLGHFVATIDASLFIDDDGQGYLYYSRDCSQNVVNGKHTSQTWVTKVDSTWTKTVGEHYLVTTPEDEWEIKSGQNNGYLWNEGPFVLKHNGKYYLTFSANLYASNDYAVGVAVSSNPLADFVKSKDNPILTRIPNKMAGPGHCMFFTDFDGYLWCCYHVQTNMNNPSGNRKMVLSGAWFNNGVLTIEYKV